MQYFGAWMALPPQLCGGFQGLVGQEGVGVGVGGQVVEEEEAVLTV